MTRTSESSFAYFRILHDEIPANQITKLIGLKPSDSWIKGKPTHAGSPILGRSHHWEYEPSLPKSWDIERRISTLLDRLEPHAMRIGALDETFDRSLVLVPFLPQVHNCGWFLDANVVRRLSVLNASVDIDAYFDVPDDAGVLHITSAAVCGPLALRLAFDDGTRKRVDLTPLLEGPIFRAVRRPSYFAKVRLDTRLGTVCWPNGADLAPEALKALPPLRNGSSGRTVTKRPRRSRRRA